MIPSLFWWQFCQLSFRLTFCDYDYKFELFCPIFFQLPCAESIHLCNNINRRVQGKILPHYYQKLYELYELYESRSILRDFQPSNSTGCHQVYFSPSLWLRTIAPLQHFISLYTLHTDAPRCDHVFYSSYKTEMIADAIHVFIYIRVYNIEAVLFTYDTYINI